MYPLLCVSVAVWLLGGCSEKLPGKEVAIIHLPVYTLHHNTTYYSGFQIGAQGHPGVLEGLPEGPQSEVQCNFLSNACVQPTFTSTVITVVIISINYKINE